MPKVYWRRSPIMAAIYIVDRISNLLQHIINIRISVMNYNSKSIYVVDSSIQSELRGGRYRVM